MNLNPLTGWAWLGGGAPHLPLSLCPEEVGPQDDSDVAGGHLVDVTLLC